MTNREWVFEEMKNMSDEELENNVRIHFIWDVNCDDCTDKHKSCLACKIDWLNKEKITLSEAERTILENIDKEYKWIARDRDGDLSICLAKPRKESDIWNPRGFKYIDIKCFNHLFQFIKWEDEEAYNIEELLKEG